MKETATNIVNKWKKQPRILCINERKSIKYGECVWAIWNLGEQDERNCPTNSASLGSSKAASRGQVFDTSRRRKTALGGGGKIEKFTKRTQIKYVGWQHTRVYYNKTNKAQASRFCSTTSHHSSVRKIGKFINKTDDNTRGLITTKQTKPRPVASATPHPITPTNKAQASRFCRTTSHHSNKQSPGQSLLQHHIPSLQRTGGGIMEKNSQQYISGERWITNQRVKKTVNGKKRKQKKNNIIETRTILTFPHQANQSTKTPTPPQGKSQDATSP